MKFELSYSELEVDAAGEEGEVLTALASFISA